LQTKVAKFGYSSDGAISSLLETFRKMCNDAVRVALAQKPKNKFELIGLSRERLKEYGLHSHYVLTACEVAYSAYKNKNRKTNPYFRKAFLKLDNQSYKFNYLLLRIPIGPRKYHYLTLSGSASHRSLLANGDVKLGSVIVTESNVVVAFSKQAVAIETKGTLGIDVNERNATWADTLGKIGICDTSKVAELKETYRMIRAKIGERTRQDRRISQRLYEKYGRRERNRTSQALHFFSKGIVRHAKTNKLGIVMENLKGIRRLYRKGNGQGPSFRGRMNSWPFREFQRQVEYKARWEGLPVTYVNPRNTSRNCSKCSSLLEPLENRQMLCPQCGSTWDRDVNASRNLMACVVPQAQLPPNAALKGNLSG
jgi:putative transposase